MIRKQLKVIEIIEQIVEQDILQEIIFQKEKSIPLS